MEHNISIFTSHHLLRCDLDLEVAKATYRMTLGHPIYYQEPSRKLPHIHTHPSHLLRNYKKIDPKHI